MYIQTKSYNTVNIDVFLKDSEMDYIKSVDIISF